MKRGTRGKDRHTAGKMGGGPGQDSTSSPRPPLHTLTPRPTGGSPSWGRALTLQHGRWLTQGYPGWRGGLGSGRETPSRPLILVGKGEVCGCRGASGLGAQSSPRGGGVPCSGPGVPREAGPAPPSLPLGTAPPQGARGGRHMMAQRFRRSAPWKRRAVCTCLQRAQPTLLSSSLKSSRMCQLYLAEHST